MPIPLTQFPKDDPAPSTTDAPRVLLRMLSPWQLKTLAVLNRATGPMTRKQIHEVCMRYGVGNRFSVGVAEAIGQSDPTKRASGDKKRGKPCLLTLKYVSEERYDIEGTIELGITITPIGREALRLAEQRLVNMGEGSILPESVPVSESDDTAPPAVRCYSA